MFLDVVTLKNVNMFLSSYEISIYSTIMEVNIVLNVNLISRHYYVKNMYSLSKIY